MCRAGLDFAVFATDGGKFKKKRLPQHDGYRTPLILNLIVTLQGSKGQCYAIPKRSVFPGLHSFPLTRLAFHK